MAEDFTGRTLLGKYRVVGQLGRGGMGSVYRATHALTGRKLAIKVLDSRFLSSAGVVERFGREARAASAIQHPGIVEVLDLDQTDLGVPFLVMELLEGQTLGQRIQDRGKLSQEESVEIMTQLLEALDAAHAHGVVHRDLKPDNVFLVPRSQGVGETIKILDFGISQKADERVAQLTLAGSVLGTPHYMAPEQALGESHVDARADVYAAAVVMYECVVGDVPFDGPNYNKLIQIILNDEPVPPRERGARITPGLEEVILSGLAKDRDQRPASAGAFLEAIRAVTSDSTAPFDRETLGFVRQGRPPTGPIARKPLAATLDGSGPAPEPAAPSSPGYSVDELELDLSPARPSASPEKTPSPSPRPAPPPESGSTPLSFDDLDVSAPAAPLEVDEAALARASRPPSRRVSIAAAGASVPPASPAGGSLPPSRRSYSGLAAPSTPPPPRIERAPNKVLRTALALGAIVAVIAIAIVGLRALVRSDDTVPDAPPPVAIEADEQPAPPPAALRTVSVDVLDLPPGASLVLDGLPTRQTPFELRAGTRHRLEISAPGYLSRTVEFEATEGARIRGALDPEPPPPRPRNRRRRGH